MIFKIDNLKCNKLLQTSSFFLVLTVLLLAPLADAERTYGHLYTDQDWVFMSKFCFDESGTICVLLKFEFNWCQTGGVLSVQLFGEKYQPRA